MPVSSFNIKDFYSPKNISPKTTIETKPKKRTVTRLRTISSAVIARLATIQTAFLEIAVFIFSKEHAAMFARHAVHNAIELFCRMCTGTTCAESVMCMRTNSIQII
jgi:glycerol dehydrogenase-like iron-containing ADH family enzyme